MVARFKTQNNTGTRFFVCLALLLVLVLGFTVNITCEEERRQEIIDGLLETKEVNVFSLDSNDDFRIDVADLVYEVNKSQYLKDAARVKKSADTEIKTIADVELFYSNFSTAIDELAVFLATLAEMGQEHTSAAKTAALSGATVDSVTVMIAKIKELDTQDELGFWDGEEVFRTHLVGLSKDGNSSDHALALSNITPEAFAAAMLSRFGESTHLPVDEGVHTINTYIRVFLNHLTDELRPSASWFEAALLASIDEPLDEAPAIKTRKRHVASLIKNFYEAEGCLTTAGKRIVELMADETGPGPDEFIPREYVTPIGKWKPVEILLNLLEEHPLLYEQLASYFDSLLNKNEDQINKQATETLLYQVDMSLWQDGRQHRDLLSFSKAEHSAKKIYLKAQENSTDYLNNAIDLVAVPINHELIPSATVYKRYLQGVKQVGIDQLPAPESARAHLAINVTPTLLIQKILDGFEYIVAVDKTGFVNEASFQQIAAYSVAPIYHHVLGNESFDDFSKKYVPWVDDVYERNLRDPNAEAWNDWQRDWDEWRDQFKGEGSILDSGNIRSIYYQLTGKEPVQAPATDVLLNGTHVLSNSLILAKPGVDDDSIVSVTTPMGVELHPLQVRILKFTTAAFLHEMAMAEHKNLISEIEFEDRGTANGVPPLLSEIYDDEEDKERADKIFRWYCLALNLLDQAEGDGGWIHDDSLHAARLITILEYETRTRIASIRHLVGFAAQGIDFWGMGERPFSYLSLGEFQGRESENSEQNLASINESILALLTDWHDKRKSLTSQVFQQEILQQKTSVAENNLEMAQFELNAADEFVNSAKLEVQQASEQIEVQSTRIELADLQIEEAEFLLEASRYKIAATEDKEKAEQILADAAKSRAETATKKLKKLKSRVDELNGGLGEFQESVRSLTSKETYDELKSVFDQFRNQALEEFEKRKKECKRPGGAAGVLYDINKDLGCAASSFWQHHGEKILMVGRLASQYYLGIDIVSIGEGLVETAEAIDRGDPKGAVNGFAKAAKTVASSKIFKTEMAESLEGTELGKFLDDNKDVFDNISRYEGLLEGVATGDVDKMKAEVMGHLTAELQEELDISNPAAFVEQTVADTIAQPMKKLGMNFAFDKNVLGKFLEEGLVFTGKINNEEIQSVLDKLTDDLLEEARNTLQNEDLGYIADILSNRGGLKNIDPNNLPVQKILRSVMPEDRLEDAQKAVRILQDIVMGEKGIPTLVGIPGIPAKKIQQLEKIWNEWSTQYAIDLAESGALAPPNFFRDFLPAETLDRIDSIKSQMRNIENAVAFLSDEKSLQDTMKKVARASNYDQLRKKFMGNYKEQMKVLAEAWNNGSAELRNLKSDLAKLSEETFKMEVDAKAQHFMKEAATHNIEQAKSEAAAALTRVQIAGKKKHIAEQKMKILKIAVRAKEAELRAKIEQRNAARAKRAGQMDELRIAQLENERFNALKDIPIQNLYFENKFKEMLFDLARRGIWEYARTLDFVQGTDTISVLRTGDFDFTKRDQLKNALDTLHMLNLKAALDNDTSIKYSSEPAFKFTLTERDLPKANLMNEMKGSELEDGFFNRQWYVWVIRPIGGEIENPVEHPSMETGRYNVYPTEFFEESRILTQPIKLLNIGRWTFNNATFLIQDAEKLGQSQIQIQVKIIHAGDMWFYIGGQNQVTKAIQRNAVAPLVYNPSTRDYVLPNVTAIHQYFTNNQYLISGVAEDVDHWKPEETPVADFFGYNYPIMGTWLVIIQKEELEELLGSKFKLEFRFDARGQLNRKEIKEGLKDELYLKNESSAN